MSTEGTQAPATSTVTESTPPVIEPTWFVDDNTPGQGDRPAWLPPKYKKASDVGNAYLELEKKLGGFTGAPEEYNLSELEIDENQLVVQEMKAVGKELNMSEDGMKKFLGRLSAAMETEGEAHFEDQLKSLGKDGERQLKEFDHYTKNYFKPEESEVIKGWIKTTDDLQTFNKMMAHTTMSAVPTSQSMALANPHESVADLRKELVENISKYETDKSYNANYSRRLSKAVARENR